MEKVNSTPLIVIAIVEFTGKGEIEKKEQETGYYDYFDRL